MGQLRRILLDRRVELAEIEEELKRVLAMRNFLVHHYFRERSDAISLFAGRQRMLDELKQATSFMEEIFAKLMALIKESRGHIVYYYNETTLDTSDPRCVIGGGEEFVLFGHPLPGL